MRHWYFALEFLVKKYVNEKKYARSLTGVWLNPFLTASKIQEIEDS